MFAQEICENNKCSWKRDFRIRKSLFKILHFKTEIIIPIVSRLKSDEKTTIRGRQTSLEAYSGVQLRRDASK